MYKIIFSQKIQNRIDDFVMYRKNYYQRLYSDTGMVGEDLIIDRCMNESRELSTLFIHAIEHDIQLGVFGVIRSKTNREEFSRLVIKVRSHILIVWIRRISGEDDIYIEDLEIQT